MKKLEIFSLSRESSMSSTAYVESAQRMARLVEDAEFARVGDRNLARINLARKYGFTSSFLKALRYCPPKQIAVDLFHKLTLAVEDACLYKIHQTEILLEQAKNSRSGISKAKLELTEASLLDAIEALRKGLE